MTTGIGAGEPELGARRNKRSRRASLMRAPAAMLAALRGAWLGQRGRLVLWFPVAMAAGAGGALSAPTEPAIAPIALLAACAGVLGVALRRWPTASWGFGLVCSAGLGALAACAAVQARADAARLEPVTGPVEIVGLVDAIEASVRGPRLVLRVESITGMDDPPRRVRVSVREALAPGRRALCRAELFAPRPPGEPGGYDAQRALFFKGVAGVGFVYGSCRPLPQTDPLPPDLRVAAWRRDLAERVAAMSPGAGGALSAALITGDRSLLSPQTEEAFRASGLTHLLSVSGLHMALVSGLAFAMLYGALALVPRLALLVPIRKIAAGAAIAAAAGYLVVSGASVPAQRAFVMAAIALGAILIDRPAISMRGLALAAVIVLALQPQAALEAGFQMSFAATAALIALYEMLVKRTDALPSPGPIIAGLRWFQAAIWTTALTSLAAGLATDPIAWHHFQRLAVYGLPANLAVAPIVSLIVAPAALVAAVAAPFGLAQAPLGVMAFGLDLVNGVARAFGERPDAVRVLPAIGAPAFLAAMAALCCLCLWRGAWRWTALLPAVAAIALAASYPRTLVAASADLSVLLVQTDAAGAGGWRVIRPERAGRTALERLGPVANLSPERALALPRLPGCRPPTRCHWVSASGVRFELEGAELRVATRAGTVQRLTSDPQRGGARIAQALQGAVRIERGRPNGYRRAWTPPPDAQ